MIPCFGIVSFDTITMNSYIALLRAVNVGGTGKLPMTDLKVLCEEAGFASVKTYIASGNVVLQSKLAEDEVKASLEAALQAYAGKAVGVMIRTAAEMAEVVKKNPFPKHRGSQVVAIFLDKAPAKDALEHCKHLTSEEIRLGKREIYVFYPDGMGKSKLVISAAKTGTARNMNTCAKLAEMAAEIG